MHKLIGLYHFCLDCECPQELVFSVQGNDSLCPSIKINTTWKCKCCLTLPSMHAVSSSSTSAPAATTSLSVRSPYFALAMVARWLKPNFWIVCVWPFGLEGLWLRYAMLQNLIPSFPWIAPGWRAWGANFAAQRSGAVVLQARRAKHIQS